MNYEELEKLADLKEKGIITEEEFNEKKREILKGDTRIQKQIQEDSKDTNQTAYDKIKYNLKHSNLEEVTVDKKGNVVVLTTWAKYVCVLDSNDNLKKIKSKWNPKKIPLVILSALLFILPLIIIALKSAKEKKEIENSINNILS